VDELPVTSDDIPFIDAHHHLWDLDAHSYKWLEGDGDPDTTAWLGDYSAIRRSYLIDDYLNEGKVCGLVKSVHVQAGWSDPDPVGETHWLQDVADRYGFPNGIVAEVDLTAPGLEQQLDRHDECPNFRGVRMLPMAGLVVEPAFQRGFACLSQRGLSYDFNTCVPHMTEGIELASAFPETIILIDNAGNPMERSDEYFQAWRTQMAALADFPNVVVKLSGLGMGDHAWTPASIRRWILTAIDLFGTDRSMFATNWPVDGLYTTYSELINAYHRITASFSLSEKVAMFCTNAERYYRI
jgi:predicted TIM-barrel fold metal-dependent hydrolase